MKTTRVGIFETNSSSTHSMCVTKSNVLDQLVNHVHFEFGEFGWEWDTYYDTFSKASYLYTAIHCVDATLFNKVKDVLTSHNITCDWEEPEYDEITYGGNTYRYCKNGAVDHSTKEMLGNFLTICEDPDKLMRFLFSSESFIITGNDNSDNDVDINVDYEHDEYYKGN